MLSWIGHRQPWGLYEELVKGTRQAWISPRVTTFNLDAGGSR